MGLANLKGNFTLVKTTSLADMSGKMWLFKLIPTFLTDSYPTRFPWHKTRQLFYKETTVPQGNKGAGLMKIRYELCLMEDVLFLEVRQSKELRGGS